MAWWGGVVAALGVPADALSDCAAYAAEASVVPQGKVSIGGKPRGPAAAAAGGGGAWGTGWRDGKAGQRVLAGDDSTPPLPVVWINQVLGMDPALPDEMMDACLAFVVASTSDLPSDRPKPSSMVKSLAEWGERVMVEASDMKHHAMDDTLAFLAHYDPSLTSGLPLFKPPSSQAAAGSAPAAAASAATTAPVPAGAVDSGLTPQDAEAERVACGVLTSGGVPFSVIRHEEVKTVVAQQAALGERQHEGVLLKNLFLKGKKNKLVLVTARHNANVDMKALAKALSLPGGSLRFAPPELLMDVLGVRQGAVTPLALVNDKEAQVTFVLDSQAASAKAVLFHPNHNFATVITSGPELVAAVASTGHETTTVDFVDA